MPGVNRDVKRDWLKIAAWASCSLIPAVYLAQIALGESNWVVYLAMAIPQPLWLLPALVVLSVSLIVKRLKLAAPILLTTFLGLALLGGLSIGRPIDIGGPSIEVMTFNVEKFTSHAPAEIARLIQKEKPDVVCLQEASKLPPPWQPTTDLADLLPEYELIAEGELAILTRLEILKRESVPLNAGPASRPALVARLKAHGREVAIVCVHLQFFPWDDLSIENIRRAAQDRAIQRQDLKRLIENETGQIAVCGDLNAPPVAPIPRLLNQELTDAYAATNFGFGWTIPAAHPNRRYDYIFAGRGLQPTESRVVPAEVSDHRPLIATLRVR